MRKSGSPVQNLDVHVPANFRGLLSGTLRRVQQVTETWKVRFCGMTASRERVETTIEAVNEVDRDRR
jgi:hypothetical protein